MQTDYAIGVDIGGTKCSVVLGKDVGNDIAFSFKTVFKTPDSPNETLAILNDHIHTILRNCQTSGIKPVGVGISCGGPLCSREGVIMSPPNLPKWDNIHIVKHMNDCFDMPAWLNNDADACAVAEWKYGAGVGCRNVIFLTFGTGMGAGLILNGQLYTGTNDMAGEVGHVRMHTHGPSGYGKLGSFEGFCSGGGIAQLGRNLAVASIQRGVYPAYVHNANFDDITANTIAEAADMGDSTAIEVFKASGEALGSGLALLVDILNPEVIIIGSIFSRRHTLLWPYARDVLEREALKRSAEVCRVLTANLGEHVGDYAAVAVALHRSKTNTMEDL